MQELLDLGKETKFDVVKGKTVCTDDFYEGQLYTSFSNLVTHEDLILFSKRTYGHHG